MSILLFVFIWLFTGIVFTTLNYKWLKENDWTYYDSDIKGCIVLWPAPLIQWLFKKPTDVIVEFIKYYNGDNNA